MPGADVFIDTNILFYARQKTIDAKATRAREWLRALVRARHGRINLQVLNELTNVLLRKRNDLSETEIFAAVDDLRPLGAPAITENTMIGARHLRMRHRYSWWDCLLLASALELGCSHFLSEDLQDGQRIGGLTIIDPFAHSPDTIIPA